MNDNGFPKYQWSIFTKNGKDEQYVVRANTISDFTLQIANIKSLLRRDSEATTSLAKPVEETSSELNNLADFTLCSRHKYEDGSQWQMKKHVTKWGIKYFHARKDENDEWEKCMGHGFPNEIA